MTNTAILAVSALLVFAYLLDILGRRYRLRLEHDGPVEFDAQVNLRTRHPLQMRLEPR